MPKRSADKISGETTGESAYPEAKLQRLAEQARKAEGQREIERAAEILVDMKSVVDADIDVAVDESMPSGDVTMSGGRKTLRGGVKTAAALKNLTKKILTETTETASAVDSTFASLLDKFPSLKTILTTYAGAKLIQKPQLFTDLVATIRTNWASLVPAEGAGYADIFEELKVSSVYFARLLTTDQLEYVKTSPLYAVIGSVLIATYGVRYLANQEEMTPMAYLEAKARYALSYLGMVYTGVKEIITSPESPADKKARLVKQLREATQRVPKSKIKYEGVQPTGVQGLMIQKPSPVELTEEAAKKLAETVSKIVVVLPDNEAANILAAMNAPPPAAPADDMQEAGKRRKRKTVKRAMKKKRVTRRRPTFSY
jgi:hypothetical protein